MERFDVAVIGAGLAGLWCARELGRRGVRTLLIDAKATPDSTIFTTGIFVRRTLEDFELPAACLGHSIRRVVLYSPGRRALTLDSKHDEFRIGKMRALYRTLLDDCLRAGVAWSPRTQYWGLRAEGQETIVETRLVLGYDKVASVARPTTYRVCFVVGADGAQSKVAADLGLSKNSDFIIGVEDVYAGVAPARPALYCFLDPQRAPGYLAWVAHDGEEAHVGIGADPARVNVRAALRSFTASLGSIVDFGRAVRTERRGGVIPVNGVLPHIAGERGLLVGDAAGAVSPLTAGGLDGCIRLSDFAARVVVEYLRSGTASALAPYNGRRFAARFVSRRWMRAALCAANGEALELACAALRLPGVGRLAEHVFFGRGSFPDLPRARDAERARSAQACRLT